MVITSRKNERVQHFRKLASSTEYRRECGEYVCDGVKLLEEAVKWGADIRELMYCPDAGIKMPEGVRCYEVTREVMEAASPMKTPQGVVFSVGMPKAKEDAGIDGAMILENVQDPGNVGSVLRTAGAFGVGTVILTGDCADPYSPKTVRASMGAVFRVNVRRLSMDELRAASESTRIYAAALREGAVDIRRADLSRCAVAIGNEGSGLTGEMLDICAGSVIIPMRPECESLNAAVAAAVIMWEVSGKNL